MSVRVSTQCSRQQQFTHEDINYLANVLLKEAQTKALVQSNLASMPDLFQLSMVSKYLQVK